jgi:hypothetical protein
MGLTETGTPGNARGVAREAETALDTPAFLKNESSRKRQTPNIKNKKSHTRHMSTIKNEKTPAKTRALPY